MSGEAGFRRGQGCGDDVAAYALGSLDQRDVEAFERHLESCVVCRDELVAFSQIVDILPMTSPTHRAPPGLRRRVLRAVANEPRRSTATAGTPGRRVRPWPTLSLPAIALAVSLAVAVVVFGGLRLTSSSSPAARVVHAQVSGDGTAELRVSDDRGELILRHFPAPPAGEIYEVWLQRPGRALMPTTVLFSVNAAGTGDVVVPGSLHGVSLVMVTPEPAGGTLKPTRPAVLRAILT